MTEDRKFTRIIEELTDLKDLTAKERLDYIRSEGTENPWIRGYLDGQAALACHILDTITKLILDA